MSDNPTPASDETERNLQIIREAISYGWHAGVERDAMEALSALQADNERLREEGEFDFSHATRFISAELVKTLEDWRNLDIEVLLANAAVRLSRYENERGELKAANAALVTRVNDCEMLIEDDAQNHLHEIKKHKECIQEIYALRGEDPVIAEICNRVLK